MCYILFLCLPLYIPQSSVNERALELMEGADVHPRFETDAKVKAYYKSCMDEKSRSKAKEIEWLKRSLNQLGGWPIVEGDSWKANESFRW